MSVWLSICMGMGVRVGMGMGIGIGMQYQCTPPARRFRTYAPASTSTFKPNGRNGGGLSAGPRELREVSVIHVHYITISQRIATQPIQPRDRRAPARDGHARTSALQRRRTVATTRCRALNEVWTTNPASGTRRTQTRAA